jgi:hypothetical protein
MTPLAKQGDALKGGQAAALSAALARSVNREPPRVSKRLIGAGFGALALSAAGLAAAAATWCAPAWGRAAHAALASAAAALPAALAAGTAAAAGGREATGAALLALGLAAVSAALLLGCRRLPSCYAARSRRDDSAVKAVLPDFGFGSPETLLDSSHSSPRNDKSRGPSAVAPAHTSKASSEHTTPPRTAQCSPTTPDGVKVGGGLRGLAKQATWQRLTSALSGNGRAAAAAAIASPSDSECFHIERFFEGGGGNSVFVETGSQGGGTVRDVTALAGPPRSLYVKTKLGPRQRIVDDLETANLRFVQMLRQKVLLPQPQSMALRAANTIALREAGFLPHGSSHRDVAKVCCFSVHSVLHSCIALAFPRRCHRGSSPDPPATAAGDSAYRVHDRAA